MLLILTEERNKVDGGSKTQQQVHVEQDQDDDDSDYGTFVQGSQHQPTLKPLEKTTPIKSLKSEDSVSESEIFFSEIFQTFFFLLQIFLCTLLDI